MARIRMVMLSYRARASSAEVPVRPPIAHLANLQYPQPDPHETVHPFAVSEAADSRSWDKGRGEDAGGSADCPDSAVPQNQRGWLMLGGNV